jgi:hypothetical protein
VDTINTCLSGKTFDKDLSLMRRRDGNLCFQLLNARRRKEGPTHLSIRNRRTW